VSAPYPWGVSIDGGGVPHTNHLRRPLPGNRVHFVAIGGVGMAALAELLLKLGYEISGSDLKSSRTVQRLVSLGVPVRVGPHLGSSAVGADHVIVSAAVPASNPEVDAAVAQGAEVLSRAELLGRMLDAGRGVAVTGTHGKTTTASMLARALDAAGFDPSFLIGGDLNDVGSGAGLGTSDLIVAEADEAFGSFLALHPELALVTNVDLDHLEFYDDQDAIDEAFIRFLEQRREGGTAVLCADDIGVQRIAHRVSAPIVRYGTDGADLLLTPETGAVAWRGRHIGTLRLQVPGRHNVLNAAGALTAALVLGAEPEAALAGLRSFGGVQRRFTLRGEADGVLVVDDYAHNPQKVAATVSAAREAYPERRIVVLFQPHLYSRTLHLGEAFGSAFQGADVVIVTDVYGDREEPMPGVSGRIVSDAISRRHPRDQVMYVPRLEEAAGFVAGFSQPGDLVLTLGAGDVTTAGPRILALLGERDTSAS
jgi:UDP-N-acetylmuramate--alanine ligase